MSMGSAMTRDTSAARRASRPVRPPSPARRRRTRVGQPRRQPRPGGSPPWRSSRWPPPCSPVRRGRSISRRLSPASPTPFTLTPRTPPPPCFRCPSPWDTAGGGLTEVPVREFTGRTWAADGVAFATAPNLTPDPETGIGDRTDDELARAIREGISHAGRTLFPIMPYQHFRSMPDEDLASGIEYLRSLKPVRNPLPPSAIPFPLTHPIHAF